MNRFLYQCWAMLQAGFGSIILWVKWIDSHLQKAFFGIQPWTLSSNASRTFSETSFFPIKHTPCPFITQVHLKDAQCAEAFLVRFLNQVNEDQTTCALIDLHSEILSLFSPEKIIEMNDILVLQPMQRDEAYRMVSAVIRQTQIDFILLSIDEKEPEWLESMAKQIHIDLNQRPCRVLFFTWEHIQYRSIKKALRHYITSPCRVS